MDITVRTGRRPESERRTAQPELNFLPDADIGLRTGANLITGVRTVACLVLVVLSVRFGQASLVAALVVFWVGDAADGAWARRTGTETRTGALFDILCDRACSITIVMFAATADTSLMLAAMLMVWEFVVVDGILSLAFLRWPLVSPNYFHRVDPLVWALNWSRTAKVLSTGPSLIAIVVFANPYVAVPLIVAATGVKCVSIGLLVHGANRPDASQGRARP